MSERSIPLFEDVALDLARGCLTREGRPVHLRPQAYEVLKCLADNRGRLVSKDELIDAVWRGRAVTDDALVQCLVEVRQALGANGKLYIRNVRGRGYIFDPEVDNRVETQNIPTPPEQLDRTAHAIENPETSDPHSSRGAGQRALLVAAIFAITASLVAFAYIRFSNRSSAKTSIAATRDARASESYLNGLFYLRKGGFENAAKAREYFTRAVTLDSNFALAWVGVARSHRYFSGNSLLDPKEPLAIARTAAEKALELDETLAEAHIELAGIKRDSWDWDGADRAYRRAIELNPNLVDAHRWYAGYLSQMGRHVEALAAIKRAQALDPLESRLRSLEAFFLYLARRHDEAGERLQQLIESEPRGSGARHTSLGLTYDARGMFEQAIAEYRKAFRIDGETPWQQIILGRALAMSGRRTEALAILDELERTARYVSSAELAILHAGLGDKEAAIASLERAYAAHDLQMQALKVDPHYDSLRSDPRFQDLQRRVGLLQ